MGNVEETKGECSFKTHEFAAKIGETSISCHLIKMENCLYLWIGDSKENTMNDLSFAIESPYEKDPLTTKIMGSIVDDTSSNLAKRLAKRLAKPVYVSVNVSVDNLSLPAIEKRLRDEFKDHPELL